MPLSQPQMRAIEIMMEQMERLLPLVQHNRRLDPPKSAEQTVREFYDETSKMGQFELRYLTAIAKSLNPDATYEDGIVTHRIQF